MHVAKEVEHDVEKVKFFWSEVFLMRLERG